MTLALAFAGLAMLQMGLKHLAALQHRAERAEWREERTELLNRIQHPEIIIHPQAPEVDDETPVDLEDDQAYWTARGHLVTD